MLQITEHTTDTHCATELVFALFDLLGLSFIPRLRDAGELRLHRIGNPTGLDVDELGPAASPTATTTSCASPGR